VALTPFNDGGNSDYCDNFVLAKSMDDFPNYTPVTPKDRLVGLWGEIKSTR